MKQKILKEIAGWPFELLIFAINNERCSTINDFVKKIAFRYFDDIRTLRADYEYCMETSK